jgi:hypothetical protein
MAKRPEVGSYLRLTKFRGKEGVWYAEVVEYAVSPQPYVNVMCGPPLEMYTTTYYPPLYGWALAINTANYQTIDKSKLPSEFYTTQAAAALGQLPRVTRNT